MRMTEFLLTLVCSLALTACGPEHKSVLEPLTPEEADELAGKYEHFINIYERVIFPKWISCRKIRCSGRDWRN